MSHVNVRLKVHSSPVLVHTDRALHYLCCLPPRRAQLSSLLSLSPTSPRFAPLLPCSLQEGRLAISLFFLSKHGGREIVDALEYSWKEEATKQLRGDGGDVGRNLEEMVEQEEEDRRKLMEARRLLNACPDFTLGETFVVVGESCLMSGQVNVGDGQQLRVRGSDGLNHPALDRGGVSSSSLVVYRHFLLTGTAELTLMNLQLKGAFVGSTDGGCRSCGHCRKTVSAILKMA